MADRAPSFANSLSGQRSSDLVLIGDTKNPDGPVLSYTRADFVLLEFDEGSLQRPTVFVEGLYDNSYQEGPAKIARYREAVEYLRDAALSPRDSLRLITTSEARIRHSRCGRGDAAEVSGTPVT